MSPPSKNQPVIFASDVTDFNTPSNSTTEVDSLICITDLADRLVSSSLAAVQKSNFSDNMTECSTPFKSQAYTAASNSGNTNKTVCSDGDATGGRSTEMANNAVTSHSNAVRGHSSAATGHSYAATGLSTAATGLSTAATGLSTAATGLSTATGHSTAATGLSTAATGHFNAATGHSNAATGHSTKASGRSGSQATQKTSLLAKLGALRGPPPPPTIPPPPLPSI